MANSLIENSFIEKYLGHSLHYCAQELLICGMDSIAFGHWLAIPSKQLLLIFRHQQCVGFDYYELAA